MSESIVTVQPVVVCFGIYYQNSLILPSSSFHLQWNLYSGDTLKTEASISWIEVSPEWRLGWGLFIINQQRQYKKWTSTYLCDMYQFKSHSSVCESSILKEINSFCGQSLFGCYGVLWKVKSRFQDPEKSVSFPWIEVSL